MSVDPNETARRVIDAGLSLLDRQIMDKDGLMAGKVDDLELTFPEGGVSTPFVSAILSGPGALAAQIGGSFGRWIASVERRLRPSAEGAPARISFGVVKRITEHVELIVPRSQLDVNRGEEWVRDVIIGKLPGAHHEAK
jgi:sporulation protein YlmC with PRC-barrel domain